MRLYKVTVDEQTLHFIAEDRDHLMTLVSQALNETDYATVVRRAAIEQVAGNPAPDEFNYYQGLL